MLLFLKLNSFATHIVGGEIIYDYLGNDNYRITLKVYRDCFNGVPPFDGIAGNGVFVPALLTVIEANSSVSNVFDIGSPVVTNIPPTINSPCIQTPNNVCVEEGVYEYTLNLPPIPGGYYVVYQRCCRNNTILNLFQSSNQGSTYYTKIPGPEEVAVNSSPRFKNFPPIFLCNNIGFKFDHSATDPDGDKLVYSLCPPFLGIDACCSAIGAGSPAGPSASCPSPPPSCPNQAPPPPYAIVTYVTPYDGSFPIASNPSVTIDPNTGLLKGTPNLIGQFVVGVCVQEYRGDVLIGTHYRDFQFNIVPCVVSVISAVADQQKQCMGNTISFLNQSTSNVGALTYLWNFGDINILSDTSNLVNPTYTYQDTGVYMMTLIANPGKLCSDTVQKEIYIYPPLDVGFKGTDPQCFSNNSFSFEVRGDYSAQAIFLWDFTASATPSTSALKKPTGINYSEPGLYFVSLMAKQFSCRDSFVDSVRVLRPPKAVINNLPNALCDPATVGFSNGSTSDQPLLYYWSFSNGYKTSAYQPVVVFSPDGLYKASLMVITQGVCNDTSVASVNNILVRPKPLAGFSCTPDETSIFEPRIEIVSKASSDVVSWQYNFDDGGLLSLPDGVHFYQDYGDYLITQTVSTIFGCVNTTSHLVKVLPEYRFWVPNTFTPDDNILNDIFKPIIMGVENYNFEIFDRWGEKIFTCDDIKEGWNGKLKGEPCKQDVYIWRATFKNVVSLKNESHCGHVLLLRNL